MDKRWDRNLKQTRRELDAALKRHSQLKRKARTEWRRLLKVRDQAEKDLHRLRGQPKTEAQARRLETVQKKLETLGVKAFLDAIAEL